MSLMKMALAACGVVGMGQLMGAQAPQTSQVAPPMSMADIIGLTTIGSAQRGEVDADYDIVSPDRAHVAVVVKRGNVARNTLDYTLLVFRSRELLHAPKADTVLQLASSSNRPAIGHLTWLADNATLVFLGERPGELPQVYSVDTRTRRLTQRTQATAPIAAFGVAAAGDPVVYVTDEPTDTTRYSAMRQHGFVVGPHQLVADLIAGDWSPVPSWDAHNPRTLAVVHGSNTMRWSLPDSAMGYRDCWGRTLTVAPSGDIALIQCRPLTAPKQWAQYKQADYLRSVRGGFVYPSYMIIDLQTGQSHLLLDAPVSQWWITPTWSPDGRSIVVANAHLPLGEVSDSAERAVRERQYALIDVDAHTSAVSVIAWRDSLSVVAWDARSNMLSVDSRWYHMPYDTARLYYRKTGGRWAEVPARQASSAVGVDLVVEQGLNIPPTLAAIEPTTRVYRLVYDPNPGLLAAHRFAHETVVHWRTKSGLVGVGGVYWPSDYVPGKRYPLVIQTHGFDSTAFWPDGIFSSGTAAQPLANAGVVVLQMGSGTTADGTYPYYGTPSEGPLTMESTEGAIDYLDSLGLIDRARIGLEGFSRSCYQVLYMMTHSSYPVAAATVTDGVDFGYFQYLAYKSETGEAEHVNSGQPFGAGLAMWRTVAPGFNMDRVTAPLRLTALQPVGLLEEWEPYAGLLLQGKPAELVYLPQVEGYAHILVRPWERMTSQQGTVDWFRFWLQGYEDPDPTKVEQYRRWHALRALRDVNALRAATVGQDP